MHPDKFGDSYDIVKKCFLTCLRSMGKWAVHPMFAEPVSQDFPLEFSQFLDVPLVTHDPVPSPVMRSRHFQKTVTFQGYNHLFLDPDTGLTFPGSSVSKLHLGIEELVALTKRHPNALFMAFDMSFRRSKEQSREEQTAEKLSWLNAKGVYSFAYCSHANFVVVSSDEGTLVAAKRTLQSDSLIPLSRFLEP